MPRSKRDSRFLVIALLVFTLIPATGGDWMVSPARVSAQAGFANPAFQHTWERTDKPVAAGQTKRSWYWGPAPLSGPLQEGYAEGVNGGRLVQYFDKSRMEINNPNGNPKDPFYVTNGLLTVELISGKMQTGNALYLDKWPADIPLASDPDDPSAPTYFSFQGVSNTPLGDHPANPGIDSQATLTISRDGTVGLDSSKAFYPDINILYYDQTTRHNIPKAIWDFLNQSGPVYDSTTGKTANGRLNNPWFYATGLPISEAYWARVKIAGKQQDVLIQAFQRRVVTYVPNEVPNFRVQMGNIGQHYYDWRYKEAGKPVFTPTPVATPTRPAVPPTATRPPATQPPPATPPPPAATPTAVETCDNVPAGQNATVTPNCGHSAQPLVLTVTGSGFRPGETVSIYVTAPDQAVSDLGGFTLDADGSGSVQFTLRTRLGAVLETGIWAVTMESVSTHYKAIGYWKIIP